MSEARDLAKIEALIERNSPEAQRRMAFYIHSRFGGSLTNAEKQKRYRDRMRYQPVTDLVDHAVTENGDQAVTFPPTPPVVSSSSSSSPAFPEVLASKQKQLLNGSFESSYPGFKTFWKLFPKRVGRGAAERAWKKNGCESVAKTITDSLQNQLSFLLRDDAKFVPNPATWLNEHRWQDEPPSGRHESLSVRLWREAQEEKAR